MIRLTLAVCALALAGHAAHAADCSAEVLEAFKKQRTSKAFRVALTQPTLEGPVDMTVDYAPPDRMLQTVVGKHMPGEQQTMLVGDRAYAGSSGVFEELLPHLAQSVVSEFHDAIAVPPPNMGVFECLGKSTFEGRDVVGYRSVDPDAAKNTPDSLARTIYVDGATGLPAFNLVGPRGGGGELAMKAVYSYPETIEIVAPANAPVQKQN